MTRLDLVIEMVFGVSFLSMVRVCSETCKIGKGPYAFGTNLLYLSAMRLIVKMNSGGLFTYTDRPRENLGIV